jgi:hypothetical protein
MIVAERGGAIAEAAVPDLVRAAADRPFSASRIVEVGPLTVAIHFADRDVEALFADAFYPAPAAGSAFWSLFVLAAAEGEPLPLPGFSANEPDMRLVESADRYCLWMGRHSPSLYVVDRPSRRAVCWVAEKRAVKAWERSRPFLPVLQAMLDDSPWLAIHAAALAIKNQAILLAGPGHAGKTTLSLAGLSAGWRFIGDDYVLMDSRGEAPAVAPLFATARLRDDMVARFRSLAGARSAVSHDFGERRHELSLWGVPELRGGAVPLERLLFLERSGHPAPDFAPIRRSKVLAAMAANIFIATPGAKEPRLRKLSRLLTAVPSALFDPGPRIEDALAAMMAGLR